MYFFSKKFVEKDIIFGNIWQISKIITTGMFPLWILSLISSLRTCIDLNHSLSVNDVSATVPSLEVLELSFSLKLLIFLILITASRNLVAPMKFKIRVTISWYGNWPRVGKHDTTISAVDSWGRTVWTSRCYRSCRRMSTWNYCCLWILLRHCWHAHYRNCCCLLMFLRHFRRARHRNCCCLQMLLQHCQPTRKRKKRCLGVGWHTITSDQFVWPAASSSCVLFLGAS